MSMSGNRTFKLSPRAGKFGISCDASGAFVDDIPLLQRASEDGRRVWVPRACDDLSNDLSSHFGLPIDLSSRSGALDLIARALNAGDMARAQVTTVQLAFPEPPQLAKDEDSLEALKQFVRELHWSGLLKADWDPDEHPRWPVGSPDSQGGQFAPKDESLGTALDTTTNSNRLAIPTRNEIPESGGMSADGEDRGSFNAAALVPAVEHGEDGNMFDPVAYQGYFHDEVVEGLAQYFRDNGYKRKPKFPLKWRTAVGALASIFL
jgi:hypothetical protein